MVTKEEYKQFWVVIVKLNQVKIIIHSASADLSADMSEDRF